MTNPVNNIIRQAKQGSVAAIIQVLNEKLADGGVRTRAIFADGMLQVLCEAATPEQLEQSMLVQRVQTILEAIAPRNIRRVNINSRIVREQQLLWLEEINRDPENQLLWSQEITLKRPNIFQQLMDDWHVRQADLLESSVSRASSRKPKENQQFRRGLAAGGGAVLMLLLAGWLLYPRWSSLLPKQSNSTAQAPSNPDAPDLKPSSIPASAQATAQKDDPFAAAVNLAQQTVQDSKTAELPAQWLDIAANWQKASDLMAQIPDTDDRYSTAQDRVIVYRQNSEKALEQAKLRRTEPDTAPSTVEQ